MRKLIFSIIAVFLISIAVLTVILFNTSPRTSTFTLFSFYLCLWLTVWSLILLTVIIIFPKNIKSKIIMLTRRTFLVSLAVTGLIFFSSVNVLNLLSALTLVFAVILIEMFFINRKIERTK